MIEKPHAAMRSRAAEIASTKIDTHSALDVDFRRSRPAAGQALSRADRLREALALSAHMRSSRALALSTPKLLGAEGRGLTPVARRAQAP